MHDARAIRELLARPEHARVLGPFRLRSQLGRGGSAPVWLADECYGDVSVRQAAVKLFPFRAQSDRSRDQLIREAQLLCRVDHPNIVRFYSLVLDEHAGVGGLAMERVMGRTVGRQIAETGPLGLPKTLRIGVAVARALTEMHRAGLLHRDVKPDNIMDAQSTFKLIDFGIAVSVDYDDHDDDDDEDTPRAQQDDPDQTARLPRGPVGTRGYLAPERLRGEPATAASDLFALGATLHTCLLGYPPHANAQQTPRDVLETNLALWTLILTLLAEDPAKRPPSAAQVAERLLALLRENNHSQGQLPPENVGPFRGLLRFEQADREVFFGRDAEIGAALSLLRRHPLVLLTGPSGSGKSSLGRAGILPGLVEEALDVWPTAWDTVVLTPGPDPHASLLAALQPFMLVGPSLDPSLDAAALVDALCLRAERQGRGLCLFVDQLEELATLSFALEGADASRRFLIEFLAHLSDRPLIGVRALVAARRDLLEPLLAQEGLGKSLARAMLLVEPLSPAALRDVLTQALSVYGYSLEDPAMSGELLPQVIATKDAMPLIAFAWAELWRVRDPLGKRLTRAGLAAIGGVSGALVRHAETTLDTLLAQDAGFLPAVRRMLLSLTTPEATRCPKSEERLLCLGGAGAKRVLETLVEARIVVPVEGGFSLAHEALLSQWPRFRAWFEEALDERRLIAEIEQATALWRASQEMAPLLKGERLACAEKLLVRDQDGLGDDAQAFVRASRRAARGQLARTAALVASLMGLLLGGFLASLFVLRERASTREARLQFLEQNQSLAEQLAEARRQLDAAQSDTEKRERTEALQKLIKESEERPKAPNEVFARHTEPTPKAPPSSAASSLAPSQEAEPFVSPTGLEPLAPSASPEPTPPAGRRKHRFDVERSR